VSQTETTSWRLIEGAARGGAQEREEFARRYAPVARAYLSSRWRNSPLKVDLDDAVQDAFIECYRTDGVLAKADRARPGGFRALFYGVLRNVAARCEQKVSRAQGRPPVADVRLDALSGRGETPSEVFDRAWAQSVIAEAIERHEAWSRAEGDAAWRRFELLRLRFQESQPIRDIARLWKVDAADLHHDYSAARREFEAVLREVIAERSGGTPEQVERALKELLAAIR
jgi:DNA-directed RNA polymerase specialized sigma24 family protein